MLLPISEMMVAGSSRAVPKIIPNATADSDDHRFNHDDLRNLVKNNNLEMLAQYNGVAGLAKALQINLVHGVISGRDRERRKIEFGSNTYEKPSSKGFFCFVLMGFSEATIFVLLVCAILSLVFGMLKGVKEGWYDGASLFVAVFLVIAGSAGSKLKQERQFHRLTTKVSIDMKIDVLRDQGRRQKISIFDVVVGDVVVLSAGDQIPADGLFIDGNSLRVADESSITGESGYIEAIRFLRSGSKVVDGHGRMLVTAVGSNTTAWGKMTSDSEEQTPLQSRLRKLTSFIGKVSLIVDSVVIVVLFIRYFVINKRDENGEYYYKDTTVYFIRMFAEAVATLLVVVPVGLEIAVRLTIANSMKKMMGDKVLVKNISACETMGSTTVICTHKTGILTTNQMEVTKFWVGLDDIEDDVSSIDATLLQLYHQGVGLNTIGSPYKSSGTQESSEYCAGSPTEKALLSWADTSLGMDIEKEKRSFSVVRVEAFDSEKKRSGVLIRKNEEEDNTVHHVHWKGAAEVILEMCSNYYQKNGVIKSITSDEMEQLEKTIQGMAASGLRCIAFAHKMINHNDGETTILDDEQGLTLLGIVGIKNPCKLEVKEAVETFRSAGVHVMMITGDNVLTAKKIATDCGILDINNNQEEDQLVIEGKEFRNYTEEKRMDVCDKIRVMARSSPSDKLLMVQCLQKKRHVVAFTGHRASDAPAMKESDIGISMGIQGTEVAKQSADIVILNDDLGSIVKGVRWSRCMYNNIQKLIQFQLPVNGAAFVVNLISIASTGGSPITAVQQFWVHLITVTFGQLALALEKPSTEIMQKPPVGKDSPLITNEMWRNLFGQCLFQIVILLTIQFKGRSIFNVNEKVNRMMIFNTFVIIQVFNQFNSRKIKKKNIFKGLHENMRSVGMIGVSILIQFVMMELVKRIGYNERLNVVQWLICIAIAAFSWPIGWFVKLIPVPEKPFQSYIRRWITMAGRHAQTPSSSTQAQVFSSNQEISNF